MSDPVLQAHHVRISGQLYRELRDTVNMDDISGIVVSHSDGRRGPHWHIYLLHSEPMTAKIAKKKFIERYKITRPLTNGDWGWSDPKSIEGFWAYTMSGYKSGKQHQFDGYARVGAECIKWGISEPRASEFPVRPEMPVVSTMPVTLVVPKGKKKPIKDAFYEHCLKRFEGNQSYIKKDEVLREFIRWSKYGYTDYQIIPCVRYAYYSLNDTDEMRESIENAAIEILIGKI